MEFKIIEDKRNDLFNRKEITLDVKAKISPSNEDVEKWIADNFKSESNAIVIRGIKGKFGSQIFSVSANVYDSFADKERTEVKTKKQREAEKKLIDDRIKAETEARKEKEAADKAAAEEKAAAEKPVEEEKPAEEVKAPEVEEVKEGSN